MPVCKMCVHAVKLLNMGSSFLPPVLVLCSKQCESVPFVFYAGACVLQYREVRDQDRDMFLSGLSRRDMKVRAPDA